MFCRHFYLLSVEPGEEHGVLLDLAVVGEDDGVGPGLELDGQVGRLGVGVSACAAQRVQQVVVTLGHAPQVQTRQVRIGNR